jgi:hypothetical protein
MLAVAAQEEVGNEIFSTTETKFMRIHFAHAQTLVGVLVARETYVE